MPVQSRGNVSEMNPNIAKDNDAKRPTQPFQLAYKGNDDCEKKCPKFTVLSTKVPEATMLDASVTY